MNATTGWGYYMQGSDQQVEVDELGSYLSATIHCGVHYPAFGKHMYECMCGVVFPVYVVKGKDTQMLMDKHKAEKDMIK